MKISNKPLLMRILLLRIIPLFTHLSLSAQAWEEIDALKSAVSSSWLGFQVAVSGDYALAGAPYENVEGMSSAGAVYFYSRNSSTGRWQEIQKITGPAASSYMGISVAIDNDVALIGSNGEFNGATSAGAAYVYTFNSVSGLWEYHQRLLAPDAAAGDYFGRSVAVSGNHIVISAHMEDEDASGGNTLSYAGSAYFFELNSGTGLWAYQQKVAAPAADREEWGAYGISVSMSGDFAVIGASKHDRDVSTADAGAAYIYEYSAGTWNNVYKMTGNAAGDWLGYCVFIQGNTAVAGAYKADKDGTDQETGEALVSVRDEGTGTWGTPELLLPADEADRVNGNWFGVSVAVYGDRILVGSTGEDYGGRIDAGSVYVFDYTVGSGWAQTDRMRPADTPTSDYYKFGYSTSLYGDLTVVGNYAAEGGATFLEYSDGLLPVGWGLFTAQCAEKGVELCWSTLSELNNDYFEIERSGDGRTFHPIGRKKGAGDSGVHVQYDFLDEHPSPATAWYRLRQVDFDGQSALSSVVSIDPWKYGRTVSCRVYPNPAKDMFHVVVPTEDVWFELFNALGKMETIELEKRDGRHIFNAHHLAKGIYFLQVQTPQKDETIKVIIE
jgi:hypothetical protein